MSVYSVMSISVTLDKRDEWRRFKRTIYGMFQWACGGDWSDGMGPEPHGVRVDPSPAQLPSPLRHRYRHRSCQRRRGPPRSRWRPLAINNKKRRSHAFTGLTPSTRYILFSRGKNKSLPCRGATNTRRLKRRLGVLTERK